MDIKKRRLFGQGNFFPNVGYVRYICIAIIDFRENLVKIRVNQNPAPKMVSNNFKGVLYIYRSTKKIWQFGVSQSLSLNIPQLTSDRRAHLIAHSAQDIWMIRLMDEILHPLTCIKPCK